MFASKVFAQCRIYADKRLFFPDKSRFFVATYGGYMKNTLQSIWTFYRDGFRGMQLGKTLWALILIKLFILFFVLKFFFFPAFLGGKTGAEKEQYVGGELIDRAALPED